MCPSLDGEFHCTYTERNKFDINAQYRARIDEVTCTWSFRASGIDPNAYNYWYLYLVVAGQVVLIRRSCTPFFMAQFEDEKHQSKIFLKGVCVYVGVLVRAMEKLLSAVILNYYSTCSESFKIQYIWTTYLQILWKRIFFNTANSFSRDIYVSRVFL